MGVTLVRLGGRRDQPLLVLGPALGTSVQALWGEAAAALAADFQVVGWDLPGHGTHRSFLPAGRKDLEPLTLSGLSAQLGAALDVLLDRGPGDPPAAFHYAGVSVGGAVGLQLLLDDPQRVVTATLLATGPRIGTPTGWHERAGLVRADGTAATVEASAARWFAPGFRDREPRRAAALLEALAATDDAGYAAVCGALARFDVRDRLGQVDVPVLAVAGAEDPATPPDLLRALAHGVRRGRHVVLDDAAHLLPAERPAEVARLTRDHALAVDAGDDGPDDAQARLVRTFERLLGDPGRFGADGAAEDRVVLDTRSRALVALTAVAAGGRRDRLAAQVRAAHADGVSPAEMDALLLEVAAHCGVTDAVAAYRVARETLTDPGPPPG